ncbi:hypothetical protein J7L13_01640 [bacterium]|nr:hypothetical protein [bacterium]
MTETKYNKELEQVNKEIEKLSEKLKEAYIEKVTIIAKILKSKIPHIKHMEIEIDTSVPDFPLSESITIDGEELDAVDIRYKYGEKYAEYVQEINAIALILYQLYGIEGTITTEPFRIISTIL